MKAAARVSSTTNTRRLASGTGASPSLELAVVDGFQGELTINSLLGWTFNALDRQPQHAHGLQSFYAHIFQ
jgi:hypothetical protein